MSFTRIVFVALGFCLVACASPEATRTRGGGPGADGGNRKKTVRMHEGSRPFEGTPKIIPAAHPPLERPSRRLSSAAADAFLWGRTARSLILFVEHVRLKSAGSS